MTLIELLAQALGKTTEEITSSLEKDGVLPEGEALLVSAKPLLVAHIADVKKAQHQRGVRETTTKIRKFVKSKWADAPEDVTDDFELLSQFVDNNEGGDPTGLSKDDLAKNAVVKTLIGEATNATKHKVAALQTQLEQQQTQFQQESAKILAASQLSAVVADSKVILGDDEATRAKRLRTLETLIFTGRKVKAENGKLIFLDNDGNEDTDDAGKPITLKSLVVEHGAVFGFHKQDPKKNGAGAGGSGTGGDGGGKERKVFTSADDFNKHISNLTDPEEISKAWEDYAAGLDEAE